MVLSKTMAIDPQPTQVVVEALTCWQFSQTARSKGMRSAPYGCEGDEVTSLNDSLPHLKPDPAPQTPHRKRQRVTFHFRTSRASFR
jgi:hypothetical protein